MNSRLAVISAVVAASILVPMQSAAGQTPRRITLEEALALFAQNNLELRLARMNAAEADGLARQSGAFANPTLKGTHEPLSSGDIRSSESYVILDQPLEWPGTRAARREAGTRLAASARAELAADSLRLAFEVKRAYTAAARAEQDEHVLDRVLHVFREGEESADERYEQGDISLYDARRIRVERTRYEALRAEAELDAAEARRTLALLVLPGEDELQLAPADSLSGQPPAIETEPAIDIATRRREVAAREAAVEAARAAATLARRERIPDVTLSGGYKRQSDGLTGAFLGVSLPLPLWDRRGGAIDAASARVIAAEARLVLTRRLVENDVAGALARHRSLLRRADLLRDAGAADATDLLDIAQVAYDEGEMELIGLLDAAEALRESRLIETRLRADLWESYYDLERAIGGFDGSTDDMENDE